MEVAFTTIKRWLMERAAGGSSETRGNLLDLLFTNDYPRFHSHGGVVSHLLHIVRPSRAVWGEMERDGSGDGLSKNALAGEKCVGMRRLLSAR